MRRVAFLVGNQTFDPESGVSNLRFPSRDVEELAETLRNNEIGRFDKVQCLIDKTHGEVLESLEALMDEEQGAFILLYYSGHGIPSQGGGQLYLATRNTK